MQPDEVSPIQGHDGPLIGPSALKNGLVGECLSGLADVGDGDHVVPSATQCFDDWEREVLVSEEARHGRLRAFVVADLSIDLVPVRTHDDDGLTAAHAIDRVEDQRP